MATSYKKYATNKFITEMVTPQIYEPGDRTGHCISGMSYEVTKGPGIEQVHCTSGMLYEVTKGPGIEQVTVSQACCMR